MPHPRLPQRLPRPAAAAVLCAALGACAAARPADPYGPVIAEGYDGAIVTSVVATPGFAVLKATTCVLGVVIAAPSSALIALTDRAQGGYQRAALHEGVGRNCRGAYYLTPVY